LFHKKGEGEAAPWALSLDMSLDTTEGWRPDFETSTFDRLDVLSAWR